MQPVFKIEQSKDENGDFQATITCPSGIITLSVYPKTMLTNGLPQIVGYAYPTDQLVDGKLTEDSEPEDCIDTDVID